MKLVSIIIITTITLFACGKKDTITPEKKTYLVREARGVVTRDFKYDNQNRYMGMVYRDGTNHQETFTTQFHSSGQPSEAILRDYIFNRAVRYNYTYDASNRCTQIETRDSTNPTTYTLTNTYSFAYIGNKITRTVTNATTGNTTKIVFTLTANGNFSSDEFYNSSNVFTSETTYTAYDDKKDPYSAAFEFIFLEPRSKNNYTAYTSRNVITGSTTSVTATHTYNSDGYPTQTVFNNGTIYNYTYEKR